MVTQEKTMQYYSRLKETTYHSILAIEDLVKAI